MKIFVTGGGTGGHIYPALAVASALQERETGLELLYGGRGGGLEERLAGDAGLSFYPLPGRPLSSAAGAFRAATSLAVALVQARRLLKRENPDVVLGTGGFASTAIGMAQVSRKGPLVLLEGNAIPGRTNRMLSRSARVVCTTFEGSARLLPSGKALLTGYPVRSSVCTQYPPHDARRMYGLDPDRFTLLVVGGSQGAKFFNQIITESAEQLIREGIQIIHQTGSVDTLSDIPDRDGWVRVQYIENIPQILASADLVLSRAGVSTLSELAVQGKAAILVPYPFAQADHQKANASELSEQGRAIMALQDDLKAEQFINTVLSLKNDEERRMALGRNLKQWARPNAAQTVADIVRSIARGEFDIESYRQTTQAGQEHPD